MSEEYYRRRSDLKENGIGLENHGFGLENGVTGGSDDIENDLNRKRRGFKSENVRNKSESGRGQKNHPYDIENDSNRKQEGFKSGKRYVTEASQAGDRRRTGMKRITSERGENFGGCRREKKTYRWRIKEVGKEFL